MPKITFLGAGSTVFAKNVIGDCLKSEALRDSEFALYDIDPVRLEDSTIVLQAINNANGSYGKIIKYCGVENRKKALIGADFVVNAIQVGGYDPCTITDFEIPKKYGLRQTIADTIGIGGIMRALRTIPVMDSFAKDIEEVCPDAWFLNYVNPMSMLTGYMQRYTGVKTIGLCHSVQICTGDLLKALDMESFKPGLKEKIAGINHMGWLLEIKDSKGNDLYPEIKKRAKQKNETEKHTDMVRFDYIDKLGYYCTESSEHNAEYNPFYIKRAYPELIEKFNIPLDEYPRRCIVNSEKWAEAKKKLSEQEELVKPRSKEYASYIMEAIQTNTPYSFGGNVINNGLISNLPSNACVEVPCIATNSGIVGTQVGELPLQLAAMNMTHINVHLLAIQAAVTGKKEHIYHAAMLEPHTAAELSIDDIRKLVDELIEAHGNWMPKFV